MKDEHRTFYKEEESVEAAPDNEELDTLEKEKSVTLIKTTNAVEVEDFIKNKALNDSPPEMAIKDSLVDQSQDVEKNLDGFKNDVCTLNSCTDRESDNGEKFKKQKPDNDKSLDEIINVEEDGKL